MPRVFSVALALKGIEQALVCPNGWLKVRARTLGHDETLIELGVVVVLISRHILGLVTKFFECFFRLLGTLLLVFEWCRHDAFPSGYFCLEPFHYVLLLFDH